ncbi:MAG: hypothetical protein P3W93_000485 [Thermus sp.]|nr:hypothetical protein [Thermus sp.]
MRKVREGTREEASKEFLNHLPDLWQHLEEAFSSGFSLADLIQGLEWSKGEIEKLKKELEEKEAELNQSLEDDLSRYEGRIRGRKRGGFRLPFPSSSSPQEAVLSSGVTKGFAEQERKLGVMGAQIYFYDKLERDISDLLGKLRHAAEILEGFRNAAENASQPQHAELSPFILTLPPSYVDVRGSLPEGQEDVGHFGFRVSLKELVENPTEALGNLVGKVEATLRDWLIEAAKNRDEGNGDLWEAVERTFRELDQLSAPFWDYQDAWVANPGLGYREQVHIVGIEEASDEAHPLVGDERLLSVFAGSLHDRMRLQRVSTRDPYRILFYKVEASIPAFVLRGVDIYKNKYESLSKDRSFHIDRRWEEVLPDLFPLPAREEVAEVWTKARFFALLQKKENRYVFHDRRQGERRARELGHSPGEAFQQLARDFFAYKELEGQVREKEAEVLRTKIGELREGMDRALKEREEHLQADHWPEEDKEVFRREVEVLRAWSERLATYNPRILEDTFPSL